MSSYLSQEGNDRLTAMLATAFGAAAGAYLLDPTVIELMLNPDGKLWIDQLGTGRCYTGHDLSPADAERVIFIVASSIGVTCNKDSPLLSAELPGSGSRFQGVLPPIAQAPSFSIRKKALKVFTIDDYVTQHILSTAHAQRIRQAVIERKNILIVGGTGSGKTTLANAILDLVAQTGDRIVILEDTQELQCSALDSVALRTKDGQTSMRDLLKATLRLRPDRIVVGEVRGAEALDLIKAWNTGHPGGCATIHADSAQKALTRLEHLVLESGVKLSREAILETVNLFIFIEKTASTRRISHVGELA